jgi:hypothetical protein
MYSTVMKFSVFLFSLIVAGSVTRAELPIDLPGLEPPGDGAPAGIVVPPPVRGGTGTNAPAQPALEPARPPASKVVRRLDPAPRATNDWLRLQDQDEVSGRFLGWEDGAVRWEMAEALRPVRFRGSGVDRLVWAAPEKPVRGADRWVVRLTDGSLLPAQEARLEAKTVVATGTVVGTLRVPREMVAALYRNPYPGDKGHMLHNVEDWDVISATNARSGSVGNSLGSGRQSYAEVLPPESVLVEFDWPPTDANTYVQVLLPLQSFQNLRSDFHLYFHDNEMIVQQPGGGFTGAEGVSGTRPRVGVALDRRRGTAAVYLDGKLVGNPQVNLLFEPVPRGISVCCGTSKGSAAGTLPIRTLLITPIREELTFPTAPGNADLIRFANGDALAGALTGLTATHVSFTASLGAIEMPVGRFVGVEFATDGRAAPRRRENDVELLFHDGGQLVGELKEMTADQLIVESDVFDRATVPRADVQGLHLGLNRSAPPAANPDIRRETQPGVIGLRGGNLLNGRLLGVTAQTVTWQHPHALDPLEFALTNVVFANLAADGVPTNLPPLAARVRLTDGDQLIGELKEVTADHLIVESDVLGRTKVSHAGVQCLQLGLNQPAPPAANPDGSRETQRGVIGLRGGNRFNGRLMGVTPQTVTWRHPLLIDPLEFALTNVVFANLAAADAPTNLAPLAARVRLTNSDQWQGELVGVDAESVQFRPWQMAPVRIPRRQVVEVRPGGPPAGVLDAGPIENWDVPPLPDRPGDVIYVRNLPLPPRVRLQFEIEPRTNELFALAWLYSRVSTNHQRPLGYLLHLQNNWVGVSQYVLNPDGQLKQRNSTSYAAPGLGERPISEITWLLDPVKGEAFVLLDGKQIGLMHNRASIPVGPAPMLDGEETGQVRNQQKADLGQEARVEMPDSARSARLRSVVVSEWKGGEGFVAPPKADAIRLQDFSLLTGPIEGVRDGMVHRTGQDPVPVARVSSLFFNPAASERVRRTAQDVRLTLWNGDELTLTGLQWRDGGIVGTSEVWGQVSFPISAIRRLTPLPPPVPDRSTKARSLKQ